MAKGKTKALTKKQKTLPKFLQEAILGKKLSAKSKKKKKKKK